MSEGQTQWMSSSIVMADGSSIGRASSTVSMFVRTTIMGCSQEEEGMPAGWYAAHLLIRRRKTSLYNSSTERRGFRFQRTAPHRGLRLGEVRSRRGSAPKHRGKAPFSGPQNRDVQWVGGTLDQRHKVLATIHVFRCRKAHSHVCLRTTLPQYAQSHSRPLHVRKSGSLRNIPPSQLFLSLCLPPWCYGWALALSVHFKAE